MIEDNKVPLFWGKFGCDFHAMYPDPREKYERWMKLDSALIRRAKAIFAWAEENGIEAELVHETKTLQRPCYPYSDAMLFCAKFQRDVDAVQCMLTFGSMKDA